MPAGRDEEIFAAAVERGKPPGLAGDVALDRDLDIVALLRSTGAEYAPRPDERARARAAVMARLTAATDPSDHVPLSAMIAPPAEPTPAPVPAAPVAAPAPAGPSTAVLPDGVVTDTPGPNGIGANGIGANGIENDGIEDDAPVDELSARRSRRGRHTLPALGRSRPPIGGRLVMVAAAAVLATGVLGAAGVLASRNALPGDGLYGIKLAAEDAGLAMTWDDGSRGRQHLVLASTRIDEAEQLIAQDPDGELDPEAVRSALQQFDAHADEGSRLLLAAEDLSPEQAEAEWAEWAAGQVTRLGTLRDSLPEQIATDADGSLTRLQQLAGPDALSTLAVCTPAGTVGGDPANPSVVPTCAPGLTLPGQQPGAGQPGTDPGSTDGAGAPADQPGGSTQGGADQQEQPGLLPGLVPEEGLGGVLDGSDGSDPSGQPGSGEDPEQSGGLPLEVPPLGPGLPGLLGGG